MIEKVLKTIKDHHLIENGERIVVGVSGGPDSVCLLHVLYVLSNELNINIYAVHINHLLRGKESKEDECFVEELCRKLGITLFSRSFNIAKMSKQRALSLEETGRDVRYQQFRAYAKRVGASKIAVAHNKNDQAETLLMNIIRGTGLDGLKGMDYKNGPVIRPLLDVERKEIEVYCTDHLLTPRIDSSNLKSIYTRNKIRLELIPFINRSFDKDMVESLSRLSKVVKDDVDYIEKRADDSFKQCMIKNESEDIRLDILIMKDYHAAIIKRVIRNAIKALKGDLKGIESEHVEKVQELVLYGRTGAILHLPNSIRVEKSYNILKIYHRHDQEEKAFFDIQLPIPGNAYIQYFSAAVESSVELSGNVMCEYTKSKGESLIQFFDYEKLKTGINIRCRKEGDVFKPFKSNGTKKLKEYFIDKKIPRELRNALPLIAIGNEIVWVIGYKISDKFKVTENTKSILKLEYKPMHQI